MINLLTAYNKKFTITDKKDAFLNFRRLKANFVCPSINYLIYYIMKN